jgi:hypothetical protein
MFGMRLSRRSRPRRSPLLVTGVAALLGMATVTAGTAGIEVTTASPAYAQSIADRGPAAAADEFNNQYVFWRGATGKHNLYEGWYDAYTGKWSGPIDLGMGTLGSEPTVAVSDQVFAGPGGDEFNAQYVYWEGTNGYLWMAYWEGSWHGPISIDTTMCSQPGATALAAASGLKVVVFFQGVDDCGTDNSSGEGLWYVYSLTDNPTAASDYTGPNYDTYAGLVGSSPSVTNTYSECNVGSMSVCDDLAVIAWKGQDDGLWTEQWDVDTGSVSGPDRDANAETIGSPPSVMGYQDSDAADDFDIVWAGNNSVLWYGGYYGGSYTGIDEITNSGILGSAPAIAEDSDIPTDIHVFWAGSSGNYDLWQDFWDPTNLWSLQDLGMGPLI